MFYLGTDRAAWMDGDVPMMLSMAQLWRRRRPMVVRCPWALDSGAFSEIAKHGRWTISPTEFVDGVRRVLAWPGVAPDFVGQQDWMTEPHVLAQTGMTIDRHQALTVENLIALREIAPDVPWLPTLQGQTVADYLRHVERWHAAGVDLAAEPRVGLGSVCRRESTGEIEAIVLALDGLRLHGFGCKAGALRRVGYRLASADSYAWSYAGRRRRPCNRPGHGRAKSDGHCRVWAMEWRDRVLAQMEFQQTHLGGVA